jgi:uncharacterized damage-inducible protein DinB
MTPLTATILDFTRYNHWANEVLTGWLKSIDEKLLYMEVKSSFASIDLTLQHMIHAQNFWHAVLSKSDTDALDEEVRINFAGWVMKELLKGSQNLVNLVASLSDEGLLTRVSSPAVTQARYEFILHAVNHNSHHRGQIMTIIRTLGVVEGIPNTDYDTYLWMKSNKSELQPGAHS